MPQPVACMPALRHVPAPKRCAPPEAHRLCPIRIMAEDGSFLAWGREVTGDLAAAERREWLCVNGIGGFASGTVAGSLTRRYHGLLVAALAAPLGRTLLAAAVHDTLAYADTEWPLF